MILTSTISDNLISQILIALFYIVENVCNYLIVIMRIFRALLSMPNPFLSCEKIRIGYNWLINLSLAV